MTSHGILAQDASQMKPALLRGACLKCPRCGEGKLLRGYLKVADGCTSCGLDLTPQRADDGPAYIVILFVAHLIAVCLPLMFSWLGDNPVLIAAILGSATVLLSLLMLPLVKGMFVALQWVKGMHGFDPQRRPVRG